MALRARAPLELSRILSRLSNGNSYGGLKSLNAGPLSSLNNFQISNSGFGLTQARFKSDARLPEISEFTIPETPVNYIFSDWTPVLWTQDLLYQAHDLSGLAWAPTIVLSSVCLRMLLGLPVLVTQEKSLQRLVALKPEIEKLATDLKMEVGIAVKLYKWDQKKATREFKRNFKKHYDRLIVENNCHPFRAVALPLVQLPIWIAMSSAIRNTACLLPTNLPDTTEQHLRYMQMAVENPGWIESLVTADPFILPGLFVLVNLVNIQIHSASKLTVAQTKLQKALPVVFRGVIVGVGLVATYVPAAVSLYWVSSSVAALSLNILLKLNPVRRVFRLPPQPYFKIQLPFLKSSKSV